MSYCLVTTFETWVTHRDWFTHATLNPAAMPHLLVDRSQCTDPFLDQFTPVAAARPLLSGICRRRTRYPIGGRIIYVTRIDRRILPLLHRQATSPTRSLYLVVAALSITEIHATHRDAANTFSPNRYAPEPTLTPFPPNLVHLPYPGAALARGSCITHDVTTTRPTPHTPRTSTAIMHRRHYAAYRSREPGLPVAECRFLRGIRYLDPSNAPMISPSAWGGNPMGRRGLRVDASTFDGLLAFAESFVELA